MNKKRILGIIRHAIGGAGGVAVGLGYVDEGTATEIAGAALILISFIASFFSPEKSN